MLNERQLFSFLVRRLLYTNLDVVPMSVVKLTNVTSLMTSATLSRNDLHRSGTAVWRKSASTPEWLVVECDRRVTCFFNVDVDQEDEDARLAIQTGHNA